MVTVPASVKTLFSSRCILTVICFIPFYRLFEMIENMLIITSGFEGISRHCIRPKQILRYFHRRAMILGLGQLGLIWFAGGDGCNICKFRKRISMVFWLKITG